MYKENGEKRKRKTTTHCTYTKLAAPKSQFTAPRFFFFNMINGSCFNSRHHPKKCGSIQKVLVPFKNGLHDNFFYFLFFY